ncbi:hypothetical protein N7524_003713 [Penicillium chrysogenum]|nr:hypothetical protein N7524_003713 [Penicillium chrysogenum]
MHQSKGHSSSLVLTIRKLNLWELTRVALITLHYRQCSTQSHGLHTIPSPVASNNAACPRWKIANQDSESTTGCGDSSASLVASKLEASVLPDSELSRLLLRRSTPSSTVKYTVASGLFRQIEDKTKVAADERALSRLPPSSAPPSHYCGVPEPLASRHIHPPWKCNVYRKRRSFFEASADRDELERDVAWLVTALQRVTLTTFFTARPFTTTLTTTLINTHQHSPSTLTINTHHQHSPSTLTINTHHQHSPSTLTINTHHQHSPSTLTINTHHQHSPSTLTINTHHQHSPSTLTINTHHQHSPSTLTINTHINTHINTNGSTPQAFQDNTHLCLPNLNERCQFLFQRGSYWITSYQGKGTGNTSFDNEDA